MATTCLSNMKALCTYIWQQITITIDFPKAGDYQQQLQCAKRWQWDDSHIIKVCILYSVQPFEQYYNCGHSRRKLGFLTQMHAKRMEDVIITIWVGSLFHQYKVTTRINFQHLHMLAEISIILGLIFPYRTADQNINTLPTRWFFN
jgi:hypothetical protein